MIQLYALQSLIISPISGILHKQYMEYINVADTSDFSSNPSSWKVFKAAFSQT